MVKDTDRPRERYLPAYRKFWLLTDSEKRPTDTESNSPLYVTLNDSSLISLASLIWYKLELPQPHDVYREVDFSPFIPSMPVKQVAKRFWQNTTSTKYLSRMVGHLGASPDLLRRRVFIASSLATPHGLWVTKVLNPNRPAASYSFFVQAFGGRNAVPCNCCEARAYSLRDDSTGAWVCEPYFECVSMPGEPCANCIYHEDTLKECSYADEEVCKEFGYGMGKGKKRRKSGEYTGVGIARSRIDQRTTKRSHAQVLDFTEDIASVADRQIHEYGATPESFMFANHLFMVEPPLDLDYDKIEELPSRVRGKAS